MKSDSKKVAAKYLKLSKLRIVELLLITTVPSMVVSIYGFPPLELILATVLGGTLLAVSANVLNQIFEISTDSLMERTVNRPLVTGEVSKKNAYIYSISLGLIGYLILYTQSTILAANIALSANIFYSFIYTLILKPRTNQNIVIGGAAGAAPVLIGWAATGSELEIGSWLLFLLVFLWTPAHFWALSLENIDDYKDADFPMLPTQESKKRTTIFIGVYSCATVITSILLAPILQLGITYLVLALIFGVYLMYKSYGLYLDKVKPISYFIFSNTYLAAIFLSMVGDIFITLGSI
ncbi:heme o synthase [Acidimicrobiaceae bacterium]|jgi:protoheme IX farnesyltransferase|nr:heme o synthase [Acidimicrobiaceae bacterium]|tara:strand:- start:194 stop:1075 length:882 start_codon:yes stop_codon:yes gene_type:complete